MQAQIVYINRDLDFSIWLKNADGSAYDPGAAQYRLRLFSEPGIVLVDLAWGGGISLGNAPTGRLDVAGGLQPAIAAVSVKASMELVRSDTGADVVAVWPVVITTEGMVPYQAGSAITVFLGGGVLVTAGGGFGGPAGSQGATGAAGPSALMSSVLPLLPNGDFSQWSRGIGPFTASGMVADGVRFTLNAGSTHSLSQVAGLTPQSEFALLWNRSVAGTGTGLLWFPIENIRQYHGKSLTFAFDIQAAAGFTFQSRMNHNYGTGGSSATTPGSASHTATGAVDTITRTFNIDTSGKTIGPLSHLSLQIARLAGNSDGGLKIGNVRGYVGILDYGMPVLDPPIQRGLLDRRTRLINTRTVNGTHRVEWGTKMRTTPSVTATVGTVSSVTEDGCNLTHTSAVDTVITASAEP